MISYAILLCLALALNAGEWRMVFLTAAVGVGIFCPVPDANFYFTCMFGELLIGVVALQLNTSASVPIWRMSILLLTFHILGYTLNGYPENSPYHLMVKISEHVELLTCILLSRPVLKRISRG